MLFLFPYHSFELSDKFSQHGPVSEWVGKVPESPEQHHAEKHCPGNQYVTRDRYGDDLPAELDLDEALDDDTDEYQPSVATKPWIGISTVEENGKEKRIGELKLLSPVACY